MLAHSLKARLILFSIATTVASLWVLSLYASHALQKDTEKLLGEQQFSTVSFVAAEIGNELRDRRTALELVATDLGDHWVKRPAAAQELLVQRPLLLRMFNGGTWVADHKGVVVASDLPAVIGISYADREYLKTVLQEGKATVSKPITGKVFKDPIFGIAVPIRNPQGQLVGAIAGFTDLSQPNFLDKVTQSSFGKSGGYLLNAPQHGLIVTASDRSRMMQPIPPKGVNLMLDRFMQGYEGFGVSVNSKGIEQITASKTIPEAGWFISLTVPTEEAFAPIHAMQRRMLLATLLLTLLTGCLTWLWMKRQLAPMQLAAKIVATTADAGGFTLPLAITRADEVGELIGAFNRLLAVAQRRERELSVSEYALVEAQRIAKVGSWHVVFGQNGAQGQWTISDTTRALYELPDRQEINAACALALMPPQDQEYVTGIWAAAKAGQSPAQWRHRIVLHGQVKWIEVRAQFVFDAMGQAVEASGTNQDITEIKTLEDVREEALSRLQKIANRVPGMVYQYLLRADGSTCFPYASDAIRDIYRLNPADVRDDAACVFERLHPEDVDEIVATIQQSARDLTPWVHEYRVKFDDGTVRWLLGNALPQRQEDGGVLWHGFITDITERRQLEDQVHHLAYFDSLTNLPNRRLLADRLNQAMAASQRSGKYGAVIALDLDNFKPLNDAHGHHVGDLLLIEVARRLNACVRAVDTVARTGGDEFVAVLVELDTNRQQAATFAYAVAEKIRTHLSETYRLLATEQEMPVTPIEHRCSASLGVALFADREQPCDVLLHRADTAMYVAKNSGRNAIHFHEDCLPSEGHPNRA